ncbi:HNH endonuclease [Streptomyces sp. NPDC056084]|uniref:HNH endonuclease n=1 Tax=unclassified Streptomyces TaxID=2593676 RepID=UPI0035D6220E
MRSARRPPRPRPFPRAARLLRPEPYDRKEVLARWAGCCYCDGPAEELDHVIPLALGGPDVASNVVAACRDCNQAKYTKPLAVWAAEP